ncbi:EAL domain-containing protein [Bacillus tuaregi]|uniref:EAL domain-containing protein n=1 Tax=Bacillus tuaregi TaxID=1816695 RepID=UPI0013565398|nr:EAL domain-containing protein [Bacillus tuaregi]
MLVWGSNLFQLLAPLIAFIILLNRTSQKVKTAQYFWLLLSIGCLCFTIGQCIWNYYELILKMDHPVPGYADLFWLLKDVTFFFAFLLGLYSIRHAFSKVQFFLDILVIMVVAISFSAEFIIEPILRTEKTESLLLTLAYIANPLADYGILFAALSIFMIRDSRVSRKAFYPIILGFSINLIANTAYSYLVIHKSYETGSFLDPLWPFSFLLIGLAGLYASEVINDETKPIIPVNLFKYRYLFPYFAFIVLLAVAFYRMMPFLNILTCGVSIAMVLVITRLYMTLIMNENLLLNSKRLTADLAKKNLELKTTNQTLFEKEQHLQDIFNNLNAVIWSVDYQTNKIMISSGVEEIFGYQRKDILENPSLWKTAVHPEDQEIIAEFDPKATNINPLVEFRILQPNGEQRWIQVVRTRIYNERKQLLKTHSVITDITEHKEAEEKIEYMAFHDELTGLANRSLFYRSLKLEMEKAVTGHKQVAVMFIDLDRFKSINDTLGHYIGDQLIKHVAIRLRDCVMEMGTVCRLGGDEFTIILPSESKEDSEILAKRIMMLLGEAYSIQGNELFITPTIGISLYPDHGETEEELIKKADMAMYHAKERGKNNYYVYTSDLEKKNARKMKLENALRKAIDHNELALHYQPKVELATELIVGAEALLRWKNPELGNISPVEFIPVAEETGLIHRIGEWVLQTACRQHLQWQERGVPPLTISINVSAEQLRKDFIQRVSEIIETTKVDPSKIELEITESVMQNMEETSIILHELKKLGVHLAIDDFGKGYSSLSYLKNLPVDCVKIDKSFIDDIGETSNGGEMVKTIIDMGRNLNFNVVAEGIETEHQKDFLRQHHCALGQGYLFCPPLPPDQMIPLLKKKK